MLGDTEMLIRADTFPRPWPLQLPGVATSIPLLAATASTERDVTAMASVGALVHDGRPPNCQSCTSISAYRSWVRMARAVAGSGARTNAAVPSQMVPSSDSSGP